MTTLGAIGLMFIVGMLIVSLLAIVAIPLSR